MDNIFALIKPTTKVRPVIVNSPHSGTMIPHEIGELMTEKARQSLDSDHHINDLYDFAPSLGFYLLHAKYSRYVVDLNRAPDSAPLYDDGRTETTLVPTTSFSGDDLYSSDKPSGEEIASRKSKYFDPYHECLQNLITELKNEFGRVLLFDAHSIKRSVPSISNQNFPDLILGNQNSSTAHQRLIEVAFAGFGSGLFEVADNFPFKGGYITRKFGNPEENVHTLQLEMSQDIYMNEHDNSKNPKKMAIVTAILKDTLDQLGNAVLEL